MTLDAYEKEILEADETGKIKPVVNRAELQRLRAVARATAIKDRRVNIRLSSGDLQDIQAKALKEGMEEACPEFRIAGLQCACDRTPGSFDH